MTGKSTLLTAIILLIVFFITGWLGHGWILDYVASGAEQDLAIQSPQEFLAHRLLLALSFSFAGAMSLCGASICKRFSVINGIKSYLLPLMVIAVLSMTLWTFHMANQMTAYSRLSTPVPGMDKILFPLAYIPLYRIGVAGGVSILVAVAALFGYARFKSERQAA